MQVLSPIDLDVVESVLQEKEWFSLMLIAIRWVIAEKLLGWALKIYPNGSLKMQLAGFLINRRGISPLDERTRKDAA